MLSAPENGSIQENPMNSMGLLKDAAPVPILNFLPGMRDPAGINGAMRWGTAGLSFTPNTAAVRLKQKNSLCY
jgi:hypothetical protein